MPKYGNSFSSVRRLRATRSHVVVPNTAEGGIARDDGLTIARFVKDIRKEIRMLLKYARRVRRFLHMVPYHFRARRTPIPFPAATKDVWENALTLRLLVSEWCNYSCPYCPQTHG